MRIPVAYSVSRIARSRSAAGIVADDRGEQQLDLGLGERLRDGLWDPRRRDALGGIAGRPPLVDAEAVQASDSREGPCRRARASRLAEQRYVGLDDAGVGLCKRDASAARGSPRTRRDPGDKRRWKPMPGPVRPPGRRGTPRRRGSAPPARPRPDLSRSQRVPGRRPSETSVPAADPTIVLASTMSPLATRSSTEDEPDPLDDEMLLLDPVRGPVARR